MRLAPSNAILDHGTEAGPSRRGGPRRYDSWLMQCPPRLKKRKLPDEQ